MRKKNIARVNQNETALNIADKAAIVAVNDFLSENIRANNCIRRTKAQSLPLFVFVNLLPIDALAANHAFIVELFGRGGVSVIDPLQGRRTIPSRVSKQPGQ